MNGHRLIISHRGNVNGPDPEIENNPDWIFRLTCLGINVEVDVWHGGNGDFYLGHDEPVYRVQDDFLMNPLLWCHAKNVEALLRMRSMGVLSFFWHENDEAALVSNGYIWTCDKSLADRTEVVIVDKNRDHHIEKAGVCSDYIIF